MSRFQRPASRLFIAKTVHPAIDSVRDTRRLMWLAVLALICLLVFAQSHANAKPPVLATEFSDRQIADAKQHPAYATLHGAQRIIVGVVHKEQAPTPEVPGRVQVIVEWRLKPTRNLFINKEHAKPYDSYWLSGRVPDADLGKTAYLLAHGFGDRQVLLRRANKALLDVAAIAIEQRKHADAVLAYQAEHDPQHHPLFKAIRAAKGVATVKVVDDLAATVSLHRNGNAREDRTPSTKDIHWVLPFRNLRGKLPNDASFGSYLRVGKPLPTPTESEPLIVTWEMRNGRAHATYIATMNRSTLRIAAAALNRNFDAFAHEARGPQSGSSRGSHGHANDHDHHHVAPIGDPGGEPGAHPGADVPGQEEPGGEEAHALGVHPANLRAATLRVIDPVRLGKVKPNRSAFEDGKQHFPIQVRTREGLVKYFGDKQAKMITKHVDLKHAIVLVFAWQGSGKDGLYYDILKSNPPQYVFHRARGNTRDVRPHAHVYVVGTTTKWRAVK